MTERFKVQEPAPDLIRGSRAWSRLDRGFNVPSPNSELGTRNPERRSTAVKYLGFVAHVLLSAIVLASLGCAKSAQPQARPPDVAVVKVEQKDVPIWREWIGTLDGLVNAQIKPQVTGYLLRQNYTDGAFVKKGQLLFEIDPRTFQAAVDQAKGQLANAEGQVAQAQANEVKTQQDVTRYTPLAKEQAIAQQDLDNAIQANAAAKAQVEAAKAQVEAAKAQVASARLNLGFTKVVSLIDGIAAIAQAQIGDLVSTSSLLTMVSTVDPIKVYFPVSEREYLEWMKGGSDPTKGIAGEPQLTLQLILADGSVYPHPGHVSFVDRQVDVKTGTLRVQGLFPNLGNLLRPGQYARVRAITSVKRGALLIPQKAVSELQGSYQVAVLGSDNKIQIRSVIVGERVGTDWIIDQGLKPGERVAAEGIQKVRAGMLVNAKLITATAQIDPKTKNLP
ncbi:MAG: efflux transporter periplasmic adaptor subunit [Verrucomicrobia bacterium]|nr:MAG: efflux transporter periplasmic adaptor subunit [Verrucomicrobiota bacterium]